MSRSNLKRLRKMGYGVPNQWQALCLSWKHGIWRAESMASAMPELENMGYGVPNQWQNMGYGGSK